MADFCAECTAELFDEEVDHDFIDITDKMEVGDRCQVLCEGCGFIEIDCTGKKAK